MAERRARSRGWRLAPVGLWGAWLAVGGPVGCAASATQRPLAALVGEPYQGAILLGLVLGGGLIGFAIAWALAHRRRQRAEDDWRDNEARLQSVLDASSEAIFLMDPSGKVLEANATAARRLGTDTPTLIGSNAYAFLPPDVAQSRTQRVQQVLESAQAVQFEDERAGRVILNSLCPVCDSAGRVSAVAVFGMDLTERAEAERRRAQAEAALRQSAEEFRLLAEFTPDWEYWHETQGRFLYVSPSVERITGYTPQEFMSDPSLLDRITAPEDQAGNAQKIAQALAADAPLHMEFRIRHRDGHTVWIGHACSVIWGPDGKSRGRRATNRDITARKQAEQHLQALSERQEALLAAIPDIIMEVDADKVYTWANQAGYAFFGPDVIGKEAAAYFEGEQETYQAVQPLFSGQEDVIYLESWQRRQDGQKRLLAWWCRVLKDASGAVIGALSSARDITEHADADRRRAQAEESLRASEMHLRALAEAVPLGIEEIDLQGCIEYVNPAYCRLFGVSVEQAVGSFIWQHAVDGEGLRSHFAYLVQDKPRPEPWVGQNHDGRGGVLDVRVEWDYRRDLQGQVNGFIAVIADITAQRRLEEQYRQAQKMESVGRLAGGVAHDFNNMLGVIMGHAELAMLQLHPSDALYRDLQEIQTAAQRSADLTRQLLGFARRQTAMPKVLDLNDTVAGMLKMLRRVIGEDIDLAWAPGHDLWRVKIDPSQIDQILASLATNARDAIGGVGRVTLETANVVLDEAYCAAHGEVTPGEYVRLAVSDTGTGMTPDVLAHLFEPFFTTKAVGQGTGLGLATVYGIVRQNNGSIDVDSARAPGAAGHGTTFKIHLPRFGEASAPLAPGGAPAAPLGGSETVLLVEDEEAILRFGQRVLEGLGYRVLTASTPAQALRLAEEHKGDLDLLITDVVMPQMNGRELAQRVQALKPRARCLFMSGYTANAIAQRGVLEEGLHFIPKPFTRHAIAGAIRQVLAEG